MVNTLYNTTVSWEDDEELDEDELPTPKSGTITYKIKLTFEGDMPDADNIKQGIADRLIQEQNGLYRVQDVYIEDIDEDDE